MTNKELGKILRQRQIDKGLVERKYIDALTDKELIDCYLHCSCCGAKITSIKQLKRWVNSSNPPLYHKCNMTKAETVLRRGLAKAGLES